MAQRFSDEAVVKGTGRRLPEWFDWLNERGCADKSHQEIVALLLADSGIEKGWWCQNVANEYEKHIGRREEGSTTGATFQLDVQKTLPLDSEAAWSLITSQEGARELIGSDAPLPTEPGETVVSSDGHEYELRTIRPGERMRFKRTHQETGAKSTVQVSLQPAKSGTALQVAHEGLASSEERETMREHWKSITGKILSII